MYGVTANESFRLYDLSISGGITTTGQLIIRSTTLETNKFINNLFNTIDKDYVITNDTDSIIFTLQDGVNLSVDNKNMNDLQPVIDNIMAVQDYVNNSVIDICKKVFCKFKSNKTNNFLSLKK